jgi:hypothetical protein
MFIILTRNVILYFILVNYLSHKIPTNKLFGYLAKDVQQELHSYGVITQSVHIPTCFGDGHHHQQGIHLASYKTAVKTVCIVTHSEYNPPFILNHIKFGGYCICDIVGVVKHCGDHTI